MSGKTTLSVFISLFAGLLQTGCMTSQSDEPCRVEGARHLSVSATDAEICNRFQGRFFASLDGATGRDQMSFAITIAKSGTIDAVVTQTLDGVQTAYPSVSVDVMDRGLNLSDVERLAGAAAQMMTNEQASPSATGS
jgi:hypothetical protein